MIFLQNLWVTHSKILFFKIENNMQFGRLPKKPYPPIMAHYREYYKCECCSRQYFYVRMRPKTEIVCKDCGFSLEIFPEGLRFLSAGVPNFFTRSFHFFTVVEISVILEGSI